MQLEDQSEVCAFLVAQMEGRGGCERVDTHISHVFLGPRIVWKLKRAVRFPYADFSTPDRRLALCEREVTRNRRTAPGHYLAVRRITREAGGLAFDGAGPLVDAVVEMRRFDGDRLLDRLAGRGELDGGLMELLATEIARLHRDSPEDHRPGAARIAGVLDVISAALEETGAFNADQRRAFVGQYRDALARHAALLDARAAAGRVRLAHGDLHLRNIFVEHGRPVLFDCIEFSDEIATVDVLYDLAFLLMDLLHRGLPGLANVAMNRYLDLAEDEDEDGMVLLPFFMGLRAAIRAHVTASAAGSGPEGAGLDDARAYLDLALELVRPRPVVLLAFGGLSGSGKSTVAEAAAPLFGAGAGARVLSSDRLRKALHGVSAETRLGPEAYARSVSSAVYRQLCGRASALLGRGIPVVADAVFADPQERARIEAAAGDAAFHGFWLEAPADVLRARVSARAGGPSDATVTVLEDQLGRDLGAIHWTCLDATRPAQVLAARVREIAGASA